MTEETDASRTGGTEHTSSTTRHSTDNESTLSVITRFLKSTFGQVSAAVAACLVAAVGVWLQPLTEIGKGLFWQEKLQISGEIAATEHVERDFRFILQPNSIAGFSGGRVTITSSDRSIKFRGDQQFTLDSSSGSITAPAQNTLKIIPSTGGTHKLHVKIDTNRGKTFEADINVVVSELETGIYAGLANNWTGKWHATLNRTQGDMDLVENKDRHLSGVASFRNGRKFRIDPDSWHDGISFLIMLDDQKEKITLQGFPCEIIDDQQRKVRVLNGISDTDQDRSGAKNPIKLGAIVQQCPDLRKNLADTPGSGVFEAFTYPDL